MADECDYYAHHLSKLDFLAAIAKEDYQTLEDQFKRLVKISGLDAPTDNLEVNELKCNLIKMAEQQYPINSSQTSFLREIRESEWKKMIGMLRVYITKIKPNPDYEEPIYAEIPVREEPIYAEIPIQNPGFYGVPRMIDHTRR